MSVFKTLKINRGGVGAALFVVWLIAAACLLAACSNRELCYDHTHWLDLRIEFDWSAEPDADPSAMVVYLFPTDRRDRKSVV